MSTVIIVWQHMRELIKVTDRALELRDLLCKVHEQGFKPSLEELQEIVNEYEEGLGAVMLYNAWTDPYHERDDE